MGFPVTARTESAAPPRPALLGKPIVTGAVLRNFRFIFNVLAQAEALAPVAEDADLVPVLTDLLGDPERRLELGARAEKTIAGHRGAAVRTIEVLENLLAENK